MLYHYPDNRNRDVITNWKAFANDITLPDITSTTIDVGVIAVANRAVYPVSKLFTTVECELNSTDTTASTNTVLQGIYLYVYKNS